MYLSSFIKAIQVGLKKLEKYFPRKIIKERLKDYKSFILSLILDPRFKISHFQSNGLLCFYSNIEVDIKALFKAEYYK